MRGNFKKSLLSPAVVFRWGKGGQLANASHSVFFRARFARKKRSGGGGRQGVRPYVLSNSLAHPHLVRGRKVVV
jgi:hypothetical protein